MRAPGEGEERDRDEDCYRHARIFRARVRPDPLEAGRSNAANSAPMTDAADIILFTYSLIIVGLVLGAQMLYVGGIRRRSMRLGGKLVEQKQLLAAGAIFTSAGSLAAGVMIVELLSGAAGTDLRSFIIATVLIPVIVLSFTSREQRVA
jgi:hypothetical protein